MTHEPELGVLIQTPLNSMGGFRSWAMRRQRLKAVLKRFRRQHSKCRESLVLRVGYGTAPKQHGVATIGVCSFYLPWEKVVERFFLCTAYYH